MCLCVGLGLSVFVVVESGFPPVLLMLFFFPLDIISIYGAHVLFCCCYVWFFVSLCFIFFVQSSGLEETLCVKFVISYIF